VKQGEFSEELYEKLDKQQTPINRAFMRENGLYAKYTVLNGNWTLHKFSDKIPSAGNFKKFCSEDLAAN